MTGIRRQFAAGPESPADDAAAITLNDSADIETCRSFLVGTAGDLKVTTAYGTSLTLVGLQAGAVYALKVKRFWSTGSTASSIVALY